MESRVPAGSIHDLGASLGMLKYDGADKSLIRFSGGYLGVQCFFKP